MYLIKNNKLVKTYNILQFKLLLSLIYAPIIFQIKIKQIKIYTLTPIVLHIKMKKTLRIFIIIIGCTFHSCHKKPEKKEKIIVNTPIYNYKFDDDELMTKKIKENEIKKKKPLSRKP